MNLNDTLGSYLYDLWNETEHANRMVEGARASLGREDLAGALSDLCIARGAAERAVRRMRDAIEQLEEAAQRRPKCPSCGDQYGDHHPECEAVTKVSAR